MRKSIIITIIGLIVIFIGIQLYNHFDEYNSFKNEMIRKIRLQTVDEKSYMETDSGLRVFHILNEEDRKIFIHAFKYAKPFRDKDVAFATTDIVIKIGDIELCKMGRESGPWSSDKLYTFNRKDNLKVSELLSRLQDEYNQKNKK